MGSKGRLPFDLNEPPAEEDEDNDVVYVFQPQKAVPSSSSHTSDLFAASAGSQSPQGMVNNHAFSHASSVSGFQPFVRPRSSHDPEHSAGKKTLGNSTFNAASSSKPSRLEEEKAGQQLDLSSAYPKAVEKEEGEWSDAEVSGDASRISDMHEVSTTGNEVSQEKGADEMRNYNTDRVMVEENAPLHTENVKDETRELAFSGLDQDTIDRKSSTGRTSEGSSMNGQEDSGVVPNQREIRGVEASYAQKCANNPGKRTRLDQQKEAMLGKKRSRQTMFLNLEDVKQAGALKSSTPRRQIFPAPVTTRTVKEGHAPPSTERSAEKQFQSTNKESTQVDTSNNEGNGCVESHNSRECNGEMNSGLLSRPRRLNSSTELVPETQSTSITRQSLWKQPMDSRLVKNSPVPVRKPAVGSSTTVDLKLGAKKPLSKKQPTVSTTYQDTSVERLLREVTNEKFWHHPGQCQADGILQLHMVGISTD